LSRQDLQYRILQYLPFWKFEYELTYLLICKDYLKTSMFWSNIMRWKVIVSKRTSDCNYWQLFNIAPGHKSGIILDCRLRNVYLDIRVKRALKALSVSSFDIHFLIILLIRFYVGVDVNDFDFGSIHIINHQINIAISTHTLGPSCALVSPQFEIFKFY
jgi:hypothetical protein